MTRIKAFWCFQRMAWKALLYAKTYSTSVEWSAPIGTHSVLMTVEGGGGGLSGSGGGHHA